MEEMNASTETHQQQSRKKPLPVHSVKGRQKTEVVLLHTSLGAMPRLFFASRRAMHILLCKDVDFFVVDCNADLGAGFPDRDFLEKWMKWKLVPLDTDPSRSRLHSFGDVLTKNIEIYLLCGRPQHFHCRKKCTQTGRHSQRGKAKIPQVLIDGIPAGDDRRLLDLEEEGFLTPMLCGDICPRCGAPRAPHGAEPMPFSGGNLPPKGDEDAKQRGRTEGTLDEGARPRRARCTRCRARLFRLFAMEGSQSDMGSSWFDDWQDFETTTSPRSAALCTPENSSLRDETRSEDISLRGSRILSFSWGSSSVVGDAPRGASTFSFSWESSSVVGDALRGSRTLSFSWESPSVVGDALRGSRTLSFSRESSSDVGDLLRGSRTLSFSWGSSSVVGEAAEKLGTTKREGDECEGDVQKTSPTQLLPPDFGHKAGLQDADRHSKETTVCPCDDTSSVFSEEGLPPPRATGTSSSISTDLTRFRRADGKAEANTLNAALEAGRKTLDYAEPLSRESAESELDQSADLPSHVDGLYCIQCRSSSTGMRFSLASRSHCSTFASCLSSLRSPAAGLLLGVASPSLFLAAIQKSQERDQHFQQQQHQNYPCAPSDKVYQVDHFFVPPGSARASSPTAAANISRMLSHPRSSHYFVTKEFDYGGHAGHELCSHSQNKGASVNKMFGHPYSLSGSACGYSQDASENGGSALGKTEDVFSKCRATQEGTCISRLLEKQHLDYDTSQGTASCVSGASESRFGLHLLEIPNGLPLLNGDQDSPPAAPSSPCGAAAQSVATFAAGLSATLVSDGVRANQFGTGVRELNTDLHRVGDQLSPLPLAENPGIENILCTNLKAGETSHTPSLLSRCTKGLPPGRYFHAEQSSSPDCSSSYPSILQSSRTHRAGDLFTSSAIKSSPVVEVSNQSASSWGAASVAVAGDYVALSSMKQMQESTETDSGKIAVRCILPYSKAVGGIVSATSLPLVQSNLHVS